jgi:hypothetical protein
MSNRNTINTSNLISGSDVNVGQPADGVGQEQSHSHTNFPFSSSHPSNSPPSINDNNDFGMTVDLDMLTLPNGPVQPFIEQVRSAPPGLHYPMNFMLDSLNQTK